MPPPVGSAAHPTRERGPRALIGGAKLSAAIYNLEPFGRDYAARDPSEVAAHFPVPNAEVAARLVDLLLPRRLGRPNGDAAT